MATRAARMQLLRENRDYRLPWLPSLTSGCHGGRQACICSLTLTSGLFSRAGEKPQQWSHARFESQPIRIHLRGPPALRVSAKGYITRQGRGSSVKEKVRPLCDHNAALLGFSNHKHNTTHPHAAAWPPPPPPNNGNDGFRAMELKEFLVILKSFFLTKGHNCLVLI